MAPPSTEEEEDDYLTMTIPDPSLNSSSRKHETLTARKRRLAREAEIRAHPKSKAELAAEAKRKREEGLQKSLLVNDDGDEIVQSKGKAMMAKLGYVPGTALGKTTAAISGDPTPADTRLLEPIGISEREGRSGIGADAEKKRKIREEFAAREEGEKRRKVNAEEYRERVAREREEARKEGQLRGAMIVSEKLDEEDWEREVVEDGSVGRDVAGEEVSLKKKPRQKRTLQSIPVQHRRLRLDRELAERERRMRADLQGSSVRRTEYEDPEEDRHDMMALGREVEDTELDWEDKELEDFEGFSVEERLERVVAYLRRRWRYCFWCKHRYNNEDGGMEGCPGVKEEDHD